MELRLIRSSPHSELPVRQVQPCVAKRGSERAAGAKSARESVCFVFSDSALSGVVSVKLSPKRADRFPHYATAQTHCCSPKVSPLIPQQQEGPLQSSSEEHRCQKHGSVCAQTRQDNVTAQVTTPRYRKKQTHL